MKQMKSKLQARLKWVIKEYFEQRKKNATVKDLERFINNTIRYKSMKYSNSCFTVTISAKADDVFEIAYNDPVGNGFTRAFAAAGAAGGATGGGPLLIVLGAAVGGATGAAAKVAWDALKSMVGGGGASDYKDGFTAEEIFRLLATDGFEKRDGRVRCTIRLT